MLKEYKITVSVGSKNIEINDTVDSNYKEGEAVQLASLFYSSLLGIGFTPVCANGAMVKILESKGYVIGSEDQI